MSGTAAPHRVVMRTAHSPAECARRLREGSAPWFAPATARPVRAMVLGDWAMLAPTRLWASRVPVRLRLTADGEGTRIDAAAGWAPVSLIALAVPGAAAAIVLPLLLWDRSPPWAIGLPLAIAALLALTLIGSAAMTRRSHAELLAFVRETVEATPSPN